MQRIGRTAERLAGVLALSILIASPSPSHTQAPAPAGSPASPQAAQTDGGPGSRRGQFAGMGRVAGEVTAVSGTTVTIKSEDGTIVQIVTTDNTRLMKDRAPVKAADLHPGDGVMAFGNLDAPNHTLHAAMLMATDAAQLKAMRENLGKTYIAGRVTAIDLDNVKMTVERQDHVSQTISFDESTSFKRAVRGGGPRSQSQTGNVAPSGRTYDSGPPPTGTGRGMGMGAMTGDPAAMDRIFANAESITLADIKVGDTVTGTGSVKNGTFVPNRLLDSSPRTRPQGVSPGLVSPDAPAPLPQPGPGTH